MSHQVQFGSLIEALSHWAAAQPDKVAWTFLDDRGDISDSITYMGLDAATSALAKQLTTTHNIAPGDRALLVFLPGLDFTISVIACFKAGIIAVPVFPPDPRKLEKDMHHFLSIQSNSGAKVALCHQKYNHLKKIAGIKQFFSTKGHKWPELSWVQVDRILEPFKGRYSPEETEGGRCQAKPRGDEVAFLQYTSGSTSEPKGVMISHSNLAHNESLIQAALQTDSLTVNVSWLPQYHDMGLIGSYLGALWCGASGYYLSPISFLKDPLVWLKVMSIFKATHTQAPNFAYALTSRKYREYRVDQNRKGGARDLDSLDFTSMQHMINAAEPVDMAALLSFYEDFSPLGLRPGVIVPTFGLAEHCVYVCSCEPRYFLQPSASNKVRLHRSGVRFIACKKKTLESGVVECVSEDHASDSSVRTLVSCGDPSRANGVSVKIIDPVNFLIQKEGQVGEIWINSGSKACGYWGHPEISLHEFHAVPADGKCSHGDDNVSIPTFAAQMISCEPSCSDISAIVDVSTRDTGYLRTGDLGFLCAGELFICGRLKDVIIIRGSNHYPQDIERSVEMGEPMLRAGCTAAFACDDYTRSGEILVFVAEVKESVSSDRMCEICDLCRRIVTSEHGISLSSICLLKSRSIPKTTSGKIARSWCKRAYLSSPISLEVLYRWDAPADVDGALEINSSMDNIKDTDIVSEMASNGGPLLSESYSKVPVDDDRLVGRNVHDIRSLDHDVLMHELEIILCDIVSRVGGDLCPPVDIFKPLVLLGMDSMSVIQFKGVLDNRYLCCIPDEYMFTNLATLDSLAKSVKNGALTDEQVVAFTDMDTHNENRTNEPKSKSEERSVPVVERSDPCCPWFICCY